MYQAGKNEPWGNGPIVSLERRDPKPETNIGSMPSRGQQFCSCAFPLFVHHQFMVSYLSFFAL